MSAEVKHNLNRINRSIHSLIKSSIYRGKCFIESPDPYFLELCERSRFEFTHDAKCSLGFLRRISETVRPHIRSILIGGRSVYSTDPATWDLWAGYTLTRGTERAVFATRVLEFLPNLSEVAVYVPNRYEGGRRYCHKASNEVCDMLEEGHVDVVRFLYGFSSSDPFFRPIDDCHVLKQVQYPSQKGRRSLYFDVLLLDHYLGNWDSDSMRDGNEDVDDPIQGDFNGSSSNTNSESDFENGLQEEAVDDTRSNSESQAESSSEGVRPDQNGSDHEDGGRSSIQGENTPTIEQNKRNKAQKEKVKVDYQELVVRSMRQFHDQAQIKDAEKRFLACTEEVKSHMTGELTQSTSLIPFNTWPEPFTVVALRRKAERGPMEKPRD